MIRPNKNPLNPASLAANGKQGAGAKDGQATSETKHNAKQGSGYTFSARDCLVVAAGHLEAAREAIEAHACHPHDIEGLVPYRASTVARPWPMPEAVLCDLLDALDLYCGALSEILSGGDA